MALVPQAQLQLAASLKASDMVTRNYFDHTSPGGSTPEALLGRTGYVVPESWSHVGENVARGQRRLGASAETAGPKVDNAAPRRQHGAP